MTPTQQEIADAARLVRGEFEWYCRGAGNPNGEPNVPCINGIEWQPTADTEAGRSDALVLLAAVMKWFGDNSIYTVPHMGNVIAAYRAMETATDSGNVQQLQQATMGAAIAIGQHKARSGQEG